MIRTRNGAGGMTKTLAGGWDIIWSEVAAKPAQCMRIPTLLQIKRDSGQWTLSHARHKAHARRKFHDLYVNNRSDIAEEALRYYSALYQVEREARERKLDTEGRRILRQQRSKPIAEAFRQWLTRQRALVPDGSAAAKAINYSLGRWAALIRYLDDGELPIDNNHIENRIRPVALGRGNWLFAGSLRAGKRAAAIMSLIQSAKLNGHDPYVYLKDVMERLPTQPTNRLEELLPHRWNQSRH